MTYSRKPKKKNPLGQHFIKSTAIRDITAKDAARMSEDEAHNLFIEARWGNNKSFPCPACGGIGQHYVVKGRRQWRCRYPECSRFFSVFTDTVFQDRKMSFQDILLGIVIFITMSNGISYDHLANLLNVQVKTAQVFIGKLREVLLHSRPMQKLSGLVQIDGGHFGGRPRHGRVRRVEVEDVRAHVEKMLTKKTKQPINTAMVNKLRLQKRRIIMVLRQVSPIEFEGGVKTFVACVDSENEKDAMSLALQYIEPGTTVMSDENPAYNQFSKYFEHLTVEHAKEFATVDGVNDNQAESFFSRVRRYVLGVAHRIEPKYETDIAVEMAWREDVRRKTHRQRLSDILRRLFKTGRSLYWTGYWQGHNRPGELIWSAELNQLVVRKFEE